MTIIFQGKKLDPTLTGNSSCGATLKYGDMVVYAGSYNGLVFGWYIGKSPSGKTTYVLSSGGSIVSPYYSPTKFNWTSGINDLRIKNIDEQFELIEKYRP